MDFNTEPIKERIVINGMDTKYFITPEGYVYNGNNGKRLKRKIDSKGYYHVILSHNNIQYDKRIHYLVATYFVPNPNPEKYIIVNHLDGNKLNPVYTNLEWTDYSGNSRHAIDTGLTPIIYGEDRTNAILTNQQVHEICKIMEDGIMTQREIAHHYNVPEYCIHEIRLGHNWKEISKNYDIQNCKLGIKFTDENIVRKICEDIVEDKLTLPAIAAKENVRYDIVRSIYSGNTFTSISKDYDFTNYSHKLRYRKEVIDKAKQMIRDGYCSGEIIDMLDFERGPATNTLMYRLRQAISKESSE